MKIGIVGLGRMGEAIAYRCLQGGIKVFGYDPDLKAREKLKADGGFSVENIQALAAHADIFWLMVPAGKAVDEVIAQLKPFLKKNSYIIDGGNSHYTDSVARAQMLEKSEISFLDVGTSGGLKGREIGFSLMVGGHKKAYETLEPLFKSIAAPYGYGYMGPAGAGHYVKMVHNGIEYALLESYAEGFNLLKNTQQYRDLDLEKIANVWMNGSVIRSWLLELAHNVFELDQNFKDISGKIGGGSTGRWTIQEAHKQHIPIPLIEESLKIREESQKTGGNYATKLVALLRNQFGGHPVEKE